MSPKRHSELDTGNISAGGIQFGDVARGGCTIHPEMVGALTR